jgi:hypothetical protein
MKTPCDSAALDRYLAGQLSDDEEVRVEEHLIECAACREQVAWAEDFRQALRASAAEDGARAAVQLGLLEGLEGLERLRRRPAGRGLLLAAVLLLAALPAWLLWQQSRLRADLVAARAELQATRSTRPAEPPPPATPAPTQELAQLAAERDRLQAELARERQTGEQRAASLQRLLSPQGNPLFVTLGLVRGGESTAEVRLPAEPGWIVLSLELPAVDHPAYRATLRNAAGAVLWQGNRLEPSLYDSLLVTVPSTFLEPGTYRLSVEGLAGNRAEPVGDVPLRVLPAS